MSSKSDVGRRGFVAAGTCAALAAVFAPPVDAAWAAKDWTAAEKANVKLVEEFLHAWETGDEAGIVSRLTATGKSRVTAHTDQPPATPEGLRKTAGQFFAGATVKFTILDTVARGPIVVNNRIDRMTPKKPGEATQDLFYLGVFFIKDGRIQEWSDYEVAPAKRV